MAVILCMYPQFPQAPDNPPNTVSGYTYEAWANLASVFAGDRMVMFELLNEPNITSNDEWQSTFQDLYNNVRLSAPNNVCIIPGMAPTEGIFPPDPGWLLTGTNIAYGVHAYYAYSDWESRSWENLYGYIGFYAPMIMTEVHGQCPNPPDSRGWSSAPTDFTDMLGYNYFANIGVTCWVFDHTGDETDAAITKLGTPNQYTNPWTWAPSNCSTTAPVKNFNGSPVYGPGTRYSSWMLSH